jgi:hypothetical protein
MTELTTSTCKSCKELADIKPRTSGTNAAVSAESPTAETCTASAKEIADDRST